jgi:hypothetical protein
MTDFIQPHQEQATSGGKPKNKRRIWWIGGCLSVLCLAVCGGVGFFWVVSLPDDLLDAEYVIPQTVQRGDRFDLVITMTNPTSEPVLVRHIALDETVGPSILDGSSVISSEPDMEIDELFLPDKIAYSYFQSIPPSGTQTVVFHLLAETAGNFGGTVSGYSSPYGPFAFYFDDVKITITP